MATVGVSSAGTLPAARGVARFRALSPAPVLGAVVVLGLALRLWGVDYGLPNTYQSDEPFLVLVATRMLATRDLNPHFWDYPTLHMYALMALYGVQHLLAAVAPGLRAPGAEYLLGRLLSVCYALGTVWVTYRVGRRLFDGWTGVAAAALLATSYLHNMMSHVLKVDVPATFFAGLVLAAAAVLVERPSYRWYAVAGAAVGLATSGKYPVATVCVVVVAAHVAAWRGQALRQLPRLVLAGACSLAVFVLGSPYVLLDFRGFWQEWYTNDVLWASTGHQGAEGDVAVTYLRWLFLGEDAPTAWLAVLGAGLALPKKPVAFALAALFPLVFFAELSLLWVVRFQTYLLPIYPFLAVLGGYGAVTIVRWAAARGAGLTTAVALFLALGIGFQLHNAAEYSALLAAGDVRDTALHWIEANVPPGSRIVLEGYTPNVPEDRYRATVLWRAIDKDPAWYRSEKVEYLVLGKTMYGRFYADPARYQPQIDEYDQLLANATLLQRVEGPIVGTRGGEVDVYRLAP